MPMRAALCDVHSGHSGGLHGARCCCSRGVNYTRSAGLCARGELGDEVITALASSKAVISAARRPFTVRSAATLIVRGLCA